MHLTNIYFSMTLKPAISTSNASNYLPRRAPSMTAITFVASPVIRLALKNPERSIELLEPKIEEILTFYEGYLAEFDIYTLAIAYNIKGEIEKRDNLLA